MIRPVTVIKGNAGVVTDSRRSLLRLSMVSPCRFFLILDRCDLSKIGVYWEQETHTASWIEILITDVTNEVHLDRCENGVDNRARRFSVV
jgi:hypothetical protein